MGSGVRSCGGISVVKDAFEMVLSLSRGDRATEILFDPITVTAEKGNKTSHHT